MLEPIHIKSLHIKNFRLLEDFSVEKLGRVNLIVGRNNSGKSTVLEALRIYAGSAHRELLDEIALEHDEVVRVSTPDLLDSETEMPYQAFFTGRQYPSNDDKEIEIGQGADDSNALRINHGYLIQTEEEGKDEEGELITRMIRRRIPRGDVPKYPASIVSQALFIKKGATSMRFRLDLPSGRVVRTSLNDLIGLPCSVVPTEFLTVEELAELWDEIVLGQYQRFVGEALRIIEPAFEELAFVKRKDTRYKTSEIQRSARVRLSSSDRPMPLNSMGDGMVRVLQLILKTFPAKNGFLLIDEFENGLHYSVQTKVWQMLFSLAEKLNIQVFATTHSWDCIESFAKAAAEDINQEGVLFRMGKSAKKTDKGRVIATVFDEGQLINITQADVEVR